MKTLSLNRCLRARPIKGLVLIFLFGPPTGSHAQSLPPALLIDDNNHSTPLAIFKVDVDVRVVGFVAETRMTIVFYNRLNRPLAGDLYFPLPVGSTVSGYALDVNGAMVDAVAVDKDKGRQVFERETRKGVDPGLIEWTRGNHFKTRVFPIPPHGTRTVRVSYIGEILTDDSGSHYQLPLNFKEKLERFHLRLEVVKAEAEPVVQKETKLNLQFGKWRDGFVAESGLTNTPVTGDLIVSLPEVDRQRVIVEKASDDQYYFCANNFPIDPRTTRSKATLPSLKQMTIFWDASGSRGDTDHQRELALLKTWFAAYSKQSLAVNLIPFRNALAPTQRFVITNGDASGLLHSITQIDYDGGTQLGCLTNFPGPGGCYFLFSDGIGNFGRAEPPAFDAPLYIFTSDQTIDEAYLRYLAQRSGGALFLLQRMTDQQVLADLATKAFCFTGTETNPGATDIYPRVAQPLQKRFTVVGKLTTSEAQVVLNYGAGGEKLKQTKLTVSRADAVPGDLLRRFWAQKNLEELLVFPRENESDIGDLGKQYGLVTPLTSLIVLEQLDQYIEHRILPPASLPKMRREYTRVMEEQKMNAKKEEKNKVDHIVALWDKRVEWWNRKYRYPEDFKYRESTETNGGHRPVGVSGIPQTTVNSISPAATMDASTMPAPEAEGYSFARSPREEPRSRTDKESSRDPEPGVVIKEWDPNTPYLQALKKTTAQKAFAMYMTERKAYGKSPAFYFDCAEFFRRQKQNDLSIQVLSNIAELELENAALLRVLAYRLLQISQLDLACGLFEQILKMRPEEPQSYRDLALALARRSQGLGNAAECRRAVELLAHVVKNEWDRFDEIEIIALMELNEFWAEYERRFPNEKFAFPVDGRLRKLLDLDLRVVLTWDADMTDIDIHVTEPSGEVAMYDHNLTTIGGLVSKDFTQGYGPEEYCLHKAMHGTYKIEANYYGSQSAQLIGPVTVQAEVIANFGRPNEKRRNLTLRLEEKKETVMIGEVEF
jgi:Ca-activated chloride channel family protein